MANLGEAKVNILANLAPLKRGLAKARSLTVSAAKKIALATAKGISNSIKKTMSALRNITKRAVQFITVSLLAIGAASIKMSADVEESENLFVVSMGKMAGATRAWSNQVAAALGLNEFEIRKFVSTFNVMLKSMGLAPEAAADMSEKLTQLAFDMASFFNLRPDEAFLKLQAGITGEIEPLKRLGILVNETTIKTAALTDGLIREGETLTELQKVQSRFNVIMQQTTATQGDLARTVNSTTNVFRSVRSQIARVAVIIGDELKPVVTEVAVAFRDWLVNNKQQIQEWARVAGDAIRSVKEFIVDLFNVFDVGGFSALFEKIKIELVKLKEFVKPLAIEIGEAIAAGILNGVKAGFKKALTFSLETAAGVGERIATKPLARQIPGGGALGTPILIATILKEILTANEKVVVNTGGGRPGEL